MIERAPGTARLPFPLTIRFKEMLQRGLIDVPDLDASWCSSISWFFLCSFGLNPVYRLLLGDENGEHCEAPQTLHKPLSVECCVHSVIVPSPRLSINS